jgi:hypothetical protein
MSRRLPCRVLVGVKKKLGKGMVRGCARNQVCSLGADTEARIKLALLVTDWELRPRAG